MLNDAVASPKQRLHTSARNLCQSLVQSRGEGHGAAEDDAAGNGKTSGSGTREARVGTVRPRGVARRADAR